jgi:hypothetical protein
MEVKSERLLKESYKMTNSLKLPYLKIKTLLSATNIFEECRVRSRYNVNSRTVTLIQSKDSS